MGGVFKKLAAALFGAGRRRIMLAIADPVVQDLVRKVLAPLGRDFIATDSGPGARTMLDRQREAPALVIIDVQLLGSGGGLDLLRVVRERRDTYRTPVVLLHQNLNDADQTALLSKFQHLFLMGKPINSTRMLEVCRQALELGDRLMTAKTSLHVQVPPPIRAKTKQ